MSNEEAKASRPWTPWLAYLVVLAFAAGLLVAVEGTPLPVPDESPVAIWMETKQAEAAGREATRFLEESVRRLKDTNHWLSVWFEDDKWSTGVTCYLEMAVDPHRAAWQAPPAGSLLKPEIRALPASNQSGGSGGLRVRLTTQSSDLDRLSGSDADPAKPEHIEVERNRPTVREGGVSVKELDASDRLFLKRTDRYMAVSVIGNRDLRSRVWCERDDSGAMAAPRELSGRVRAGDSDVRFVGGIPANCRAHPTGRRDVAMVARIFVREEHAGWVRRLSLGALAQLLRIAFLGTLFSWIRIGFAWLRYLKGGAETFSMADFTFAAAHVLAALVLSNQLVLLLVPEDAPPGLASLALGPVWVLWGLGLIVAGARRKLLYYRLLGTAFLSYPVVAELIAARSADTLVIALLGVMTGFGMWLGGTVVRQLSTPPATDTKSRDRYTR